MIENTERLKRSLYFYNPWWIDNKVPIALKLKYRRPILKKLLDYFKLDRIVLVKGPRRTGKTTLLYQIIDELIVKRKISPQNIIYLSWDDPQLESKVTLSEILSAYEQLRGKTFNFKEETVYLFLDEVHFWEGWQFEVKKYFDQKYPLKFILSGSSSSLIRKGSESLMGRTIEELILPFSFYEYLTYKLKDKRLDEIIIELRGNCPYPLSPYQIRQIHQSVDAPQHLPQIDQLIPYQNKIRILFAEYLNRGGFPHLLEVDNPVLWRRLLRDDVIEKVIYRDLVELYEIKKPQVLENLFLYLAGHSSDIVNITNIANSLCLSREYTLKYLNYLCESFLVFRIKKYSPSVEKQIRSNQKVHLIDSGLITVFGFGGGGGENEDKKLEGQKVESLIGRYFLKDNAFYWREKEEVDFVLDLKEGKPLLPIEVKYRNSILLRDLKGIIKFMDKYKAKEGVVISKDLLQRKEQDDKILWVIPAWFFLLINQ
jgi:predicted AAA+ superfamily ATPase